MKLAKGFLALVGSSALAAAICSIGNAETGPPVPSPSATLRVNSDDGSTPPAFAKSQASPVNAAAKMAQAAGKGINTGITVHGHWVIEVKNPDGKVTARREFENAIQPTGTEFLASLLAGNNSPGGLSILLNGAGATLCTGGGCPLPNSGNGNALIYSPESGPCMPLSNIANSPLYVTDGNNAAGSVCLITGSATYLGSNASGDITGLPSSVTPPVSLNLSVSGPTFSTSGISTPPQLTLSGTVPVTSSASGNVNDAETIFTTCTAGTAATGCVNFNGSFSGTTVVGLKVFTEKVLDGQNGDPAAVPYSPGQTIAVTVTISFQ